MGDISYAFVFTYLLQTYSIFSSREFSSFVAFYFSVKPLYSLCPMRSPQKRISVEPGSAFEMPSSAKLEKRGYIKTKQRGVQGAVSKIDTDISLLPWQPREQNDFEWCDVRGGGGMLLRHSVSWP